MTIDDRIDVYVGRRLRVEELTRKGDPLGELAAQTRSAVLCLEACIRQAAEENILTITLYSEIDRRLEAGRK